MSAISYFIYAMTVIVVSYCNNICTFYNYIESFHISFNSTKYVATACLLTFAHYF